MVDDGPGTDDAEQGRALAAALAGLRAALAELRLPLDLPGADDDRAAVRRLTAHLDDYLLPRVRQMGAPLLAVVGGSTGAGKSTLVNSLLGTAVTPAGVLRPTTRSPVLVHHPDDTVWFRSDRILPTLPRVTGRDAEGRALRLVADTAVPRGLALLDAPDIDSVVEENRQLGAELLAAADLWVFVTTAARYADAVPWDLLAAAARRRAVVAMVLNRVDEPAREAVTADLGRMLTERGLAQARLLVVPESRTDDGLLPERAVAQLGTWLRDVVGDPTARAEMVRATVAGAVDDLLAQAPGLASAAEAQTAHVESLRRTAREAHRAAARSLDAATSDGTLLRGEVLARWQEFVGTGELLRAVEQRVSRSRDRLTAFLRGRPAPEPVAQAITSGLVDLVVDAADTAAERTTSAWRADPAGRALLHGPDLGRSSTDLRPRIAEEVRAWQKRVLELVATEGADKRFTARALSFGVNGLGAALMVAIFASTGGLTAAEVGVAGGTAVLAQRLLEAVFGDDAVRRLTRTAQQDLTARLDALLDVEVARFTTTLDALDLAPDQGARLRAAGQELSRAARALAPAEGAAERVAPARGAAPSSADDATAEPGEGRVARWWRRLWQG
ncbi:ABC transporter [Cellulomonas sp. APG4]|uniref:dynamin family protein n=1 Tax=Cellulomonas sp. APG4 TaxID=1538656 RepID=UPI001379C05A|nr:dynamin family protein [Cellulomonas sp. APG4]NCT91706.1 ABC transporter [Cellulomonas sp. APG4]